MILNTSCSLLSKVGSIHLYIDFFGWYSFLMIAGVFILNIAFSYLCQLISTKNYLKCLKMVHEGDLPEGKSTTHQQKLFTSYTNLFVLSRTFGSIRKISTSLFIHIQTYKLFYTGITFMPGVPEQMLFQRFPLFD